MSCKVGISFVPDDSAIKFDMSSAFSLSKVNCVFALQYVEVAVYDWQNGSFCVIPPQNGSALACKI